MNSESLGALAAALAKAQGRMAAAKKDALNPHFKSKYADLASVWDACREPLTSNELAVIQRITSGDGVVTVATKLVHSSGEWVEDECKLPVIQQTPQGYGSAITYARRYGLASMVGISADDDDGEEASRDSHKTHRQDVVREKPQPASQAPSLFEQIRLKAAEYGLKQYAETGPHLGAAIKEVLKVSNAKDLKPEHVAKMSEFFSKTAEKIKLAEALTQEHAEEAPF